MKILSHDRARHLLIIEDEDLSLDEKADLANHLASCTECQAYTIDLGEIQRALVRAMNARWDTSWQQSTVPSRAIQQRWKEKRMKRQSGKLTVALAGAGLVVLFILFGPALITSLTRLLFPTYVAPKPPTATQAVPTPTQVDSMEIEITPLSRLPAHTAMISGLDFSPDGKLLATSSWDGTAKVWDLSNLQTTLVFDEHIGKAHCVAFSPDGSRLAVSYSGGGTKLWDVKTGEELFLLDGKNWAYAIDFSPDGTHLAVGHVDGNVILWDLQTGQRSQILDGHTHIVSGVDYSSDGERLLTVSMDSHAIVWEISTGKELLRLKDPNESRLSSGKFSPDGRRIVIVGEISWGEVWDATTGDLLFKFFGHKGDINDVEFSPDLKFLATGGEDRTVIIWDASSGKLLKRLVGHESMVSNVEFSPDGQSLASSSRDESVILWDLTR